MADLLAAEGPPESIAANENSFTGQYLTKYLPAADPAS